MATYTAIPIKLSALVEVERKSFYDPNRIKELMFIYYLLQWILEAIFMTKEKTKYSQKTGKIKTIITETQIMNKKPKQKSLL